MVNDSYEEVFSQVKRVLVVFAHPDDLEISSGGLIARLADSGVSVRAVITTNGGKGTKTKTGIDEVEFARLRVAEQIKAGEILGIDKDNNFNLQIPDGGVETTTENIGKIAHHVRQFKPDLVITHNPADFIIPFFEKSSWANHRDHRHTGIITLDAIYPYSRDTGFFPEQNLPPHTVNKILFSDSYTKQNVKYFAIENYLDKKRLALKQHVTAFSPDDADDYIEENEIGSGHFEPLAFHQVY